MKNEPGRIHKLRPGDHPFTNKDAIR